MALRPLHLRDNRIRNVRFPRKRSRLFPRLLLLCAFFLTVWLFYTVISLFMGTNERDAVIENSVGVSAVDTSTMGTSAAPTQPAIPAAPAAEPVTTGRPVTTGTPQSNAEIVAQATRQYRAKNSTLPADAPRFSQTPAQGQPSPAQQNLGQQSPMHNTSSAGRVPQGPAPSPSGASGTPSTTPSPVSVATPPAKTSAASLSLHNGVSWNIPYVGLKLKDIASQIQQKYPQMRPGKLEFQPAGVYTRLTNQTGTQNKSIALTINGCGPFGADNALFSLLTKENIPTTFFLSSRWIVKHKRDFTAIEKNALFSIQGHGKKHLPLSLKGEQTPNTPNTINTKGTDSLLAILQETEGNVRDIQRLTNHRPQWFRSAFNLYDYNAVGPVSHELNLPMVGYSLDANGTTPDEVVAKLLSAKGGDIIMLRFDSGQLLSTALSQAIPRLKAQGFTFVPLPSAPAHSR